MYKIYIYIYMYIYIYFREKASLLLKPFYIPSYDLRNTTILLLEVYQAHSLLHCTTTTVTYSSMLSLQLEFWFIYVPRPFYKHYKGVQCLLVWRYCSTVSRGVEVLQYSVSWCGGTAVRCLVVWRYCSTVSRDVEVLQYKTTKIVVWTPGSLRHLTSPPLIFFPCRRRRKIVITLGKLKCVALTTFSHVVTTSSMVLVSSNTFNESSKPYTRTTCGEH